MDFSLDDVQLMLADSVEKFVANDYDFETRQKYASSDKGYSESVWQSFAELGWTAFPFSEADGGLDGGPVEMMVVMERLGRGLIVEPLLANMVLAGGVLRRAASADQKTRWLSPLIGGELQACLAFVEPQARYDLHDVVTSARRDGDHWILNGSKGYVLNGEHAELLIVPARTSGGQTDANGISLFGLPGDTAGISKRGYPTIDGLRAAEFEFRDVVLDDGNLIGAADAGLTVLQETIDDAILAVCAEAVGIMNVLTEKTIDYAKNRVQFGVPIGSFQALQHRMVEMYTACEQSRSLLMWAAMAIADKSDEARHALRALKYQVGVAGTRIGEEAVQIHGGMGVTWELDVAHYFKRLTAINLMFGNADWHLDRMAGVDG